MPSVAANAVAAPLEVKKKPCGGRHHISRPLWVRYQTLSVRMEMKSGNWASDTVAMLVRDGSAAARHSGLALKKVGVRLEGAASLVGALHADTKTSAEK